MSEELKDLIQKQGEAFDTYKKELNKGTEASEEKLKKIVADLDKFEEKNQEVVKKSQEELKEREELKEQVIELEKKMTRLPSGTHQAEKSDHFKAFEKLIKNGEKMLSVEDYKYLRTDNNPDGGYLVPVDYRNEIIKKITETSPVRSFARVINTNRGTVELPKRTSLVSGGWVGEGGTQSESESSYGLEVINTKELSVYSIVTHKMINDSAFNIVSEIQNDVAESFAQLEGAAFVNGANVNQPEGFMQNANVAEVNSGVANALTADSIIDVTGELKTGYNPIYTLNRKTLADVRKLKDGSGAYLWQPGLAAGLPNQINGFAYVEVPDMADVAAGTYPIAFGDFMRGYIIVDGMALRIIRDDYTLASSGKVKFNFLKSVGGKVVLPEAIKKIKISV